MSLHDLEFGYRDCGAESAIRQVRLRGRMLSALRLLHGTCRQPRAAMPARPVALKRGC